MATPSAVASATLSLAPALTLGVGLLDGGLIEAGGEEVLRLGEALPVTVDVVLGLADERLPHGLVPARTRPSRRSVRP